MLCRSLLLALVLAITSLAPALASSPTRLRHRDQFAIEQHAPKASGPVGDDRPVPTGDIYVHDPSGVVFDNVSNLYYAMGTGLLKGEILASHVSKDGYAWRRYTPPFTVKPDWIQQYVPNNQGVAFWAPDLGYINGLWHLYYAVSSFGSQHSCIGLATNQQLDSSHSEFGWVDHGPVICSDNNSLFNTIDPHAFIDPSTGRVWLNYGSYWHGIFVVELTPTKTVNGSVYNVTVGIPVNVASNTGSYDPPSDESSWIEPSPFNDGKLFLFSNWGSCCVGINSTYEILMGMSTKGPTGPFYDKDGVDLTKGGGTLFLQVSGRQYGPGQIGFPFGGTDGGNGGNGSDGPNANRTSPIISYHYYDALGKPVGQHTLGQARVDWGSGKGDYWPMAVDRE